ADQSRPGHARGQGSDRGSTVRGPRHVPVRRSVAETPLPQHRGDARRAHAGQRLVTGGSQVYSNDANGPKGHELASPAMKVDGGIGFAAKEAARTAKEAEEAGYDGIWSAETSHDPFFPLLLAAEHTERIELGTGI